MTDKPLPARPVWLEEGELPARLLQRFLDKLDKQQTRLTLKIDAKRAPELFDFQTDDASHLWYLIESLDHEYHILSIKLARTRPHQERYENARLRFNPDKELLVRHWLQRPALDPYAVIWHGTLDRLQGRFEDGGAALRQQIVRIEGKGAEHVIRAFAGIDDQLHQPLSLRTLSARCFWGDSKFLDHREALIRALFPRAAEQLLPRPLLLNIYLPRQLNQIVFVENQDSFLTLVALDLPDTALVYSAGFRGSAGRIRQTGQVVFSVLNPEQQGAVAEQLKVWWFDQSAQLDVRCGFWGDLDFAGMAILKALRLTFPGMTAWRPGYAPLLQRLLAGAGHPAPLAGKERQLDPEATGCRYADSELLPAMRKHALFIDQEAVTADELGL